MPIRLKFIASTAPMNLNHQQKHKVQWNDTRRPQADGPGISVMTIFYGTAHGHTS
jgi:hypothetical protein